MASTTLKMMLLAEDKASGSFEKIGKEAESSAGHVSKFSDHLKGVGKIAAGAFGGAALAEGAVKVGEFLKGGVEQAAAFAKGFAGLSRSMEKAGVPKETVEAQEGYLTSLSNTVAVSKEQLLPVYQRMFAATGSVTKAHQAMKAALDLSAGAGISLSKATRAVASGLGGSQTALKNYGIATVTAGDLTDKISKKFGGSAVASTKTFGGEMSRLHVMFENFQESIGAKLLPVLTAFGAWFIAKGLPAIKAFGRGVEPVLAAVVRYIAAAWKPALQALAQIFKTDLEPQLKAFGAWMSAHKAQIQQVGHLVGVVMADAFKLLARDIKIDVQAIVIIIRTLITVIRAIVTAVQWTVRTTQNAFGNMVSFLRAIPGRVRGILSGLFEPVARSAANAWSTARSHVAGFLSYLGGVPGRISGLLSGVWSGLGGSLRSAVNAALHLPLVIPSIHIKGIGSIGGETLIPALAKGGIVDRPTVALIGEAGPEAVVPLSGARGRRAAAAAGAGQPVELEVHLHLEGRTIVQSVRSYQRTQGKVVLAL